mmetsp:Transcript_7595/g.32119  ORF Transcript_7595/g.32119 Transcript_7595/m.32119 type:complete len:261 (+) Transcript_7595:247-1029(+)
MDSNGSSGTGPWGREQTRNCMEERIFRLNSSTGRSQETRPSPGMCPMCVTVIDSCVTASYIALPSSFLAPSTFPRRPASTMNGATAKPSCSSCSGLRRVSSRIFQRVSGKVIVGVIQNIFSDVVTTTVASNASDFSSQSTVHNVPSSLRSISPVSASVHTTVRPWRTASNDATMFEIRYTAMTFLQSVSMILMHKSVTPLSTVATRARCCLRNSSLMGMVARRRRTPSCRWASSWSSKSCTSSNMSSCPHHCEMTGNAER